MALPIGLQVPKKIEKGHANSAPKNPRIGLKIFLSCIVALILTIILQPYITQYLQSFIK
jgi:predicted secreted protein